MEQILLNDLLRSLTVSDREFLQDSLEFAVLESGTTLFESGDEGREVHFPCGPSLASLSITLEGGATVETALVGREGAIGGVVAHGRLPAYARAVVRAGGPFLRLPGPRLAEARERSRSLHDVFLRYADCLLAQAWQSAACNAVHGIEARTAKWLLAVHDRTGSSELGFTHEMLAGTLGVGRTYVSRVLRDLRDAGMLATGRRRLVIRDPQALGAIACGCDAAVKRHFQDVLSHGAGRMRRRW